MSKLKIISLILISLLIFVGLIYFLNEPADKSEKESKNEIKRTKKALIENLLKVNPEMDDNPPLVNSNKWKPPVPLSSSINTAGAEDSPFITQDGNTLYFFFTPDVSIPPEKQLKDDITGIWRSEKTEKGWKKPEKLELSDDPSLDGAPFILNKELWFCSVRDGNYGEIDFYIAKLEGGEWTDWKNAGKQLNQEYDVGELHITSDGQTMYCGVVGEEEQSSKDIHKLQKNENGWSKPVPLPSPINTERYNEIQPFLTRNGKELWFTGQSRNGHPGPAIFRSIKKENVWSKPQEIISRFAGEPTLDREGNIYFVHHYYENGKMIEADIYLAEKTK